MIVSHKKIILSRHCQKRLKDGRQNGITEHDIFNACHKASEILVKGVPDPFRLSGFRSKEGVVFAIVVVDIPEGLCIVTVIGMSKRRKSYRPQDTYRLGHLAHKKMIKTLKKRRKEEGKWLK